MWDGEDVGVFKNEVPRRKFGELIIRRNVLNMPIKITKLKDYFFSVRCQKTILPKGSFDVVISSHVIEHLIKADGKSF